CPLGALGTAVQARLAAEQIEVAGRRRVHAFEAPQGRAGWCLLDLEIGTEVSARAVLELEHSSMDAPVPGPRRLRLQPHTAQPVPADYAPRPESAATEDQPGLVERDAADVGRATLGYGL